MTGLEERAAAAAAVAKAPRVTVEQIKQLVSSERYFVDDTLTVCVLTLTNGFKVTGESAAADPLNFNEELGRKIAKDKAFAAIWPLAGYQLREELHRASLDNYSGWWRKDMRRPANRDDGIPTRCDLRFYTAPERAIRSAMLAVEHYGGSIALTDAVTLLSKAQGRVADHVEGLTTPAAGASSYRKKPVVIQACRWEGAKCGLTNGVGPIGAYPIPEGLRLTDMDMPLVARISEIDREFDGYAVPAGEVWRGGDYLYIGTLEGPHRADPGDWIIRGIKGELYPCKPDIFAATYETA